MGIEKRYKAISDVLFQFKVNEFYKCTPETISVPKVVVSNIDPRKYDSNQTTSWEMTQFEPAPKGMEPDLKWQQTFLESFRSLKKVFSVLKESKKEINFLSIEKIKSLESQSPSNFGNGNAIQLPKIGDKKKWNQFCFGDVKLKNKSTLQNSTPPRRPHAKIVAQLDPVTQ